jgi:hypothetical protein
MDGLLRLLTGMKTPNPETFWIGQVMLCWGYSIVITHSVTKRIFVMCGHERKLMWLTVTEAALNLGLSVVLIVAFRNVLCVALGSLISSLFIGWFYLWPWAAREASLSGWQLTRTVLVPIWMASLPLLAFLILSRALPWLDYRNNSLLFISQVAFAALLGVASLWHGALTVYERKHVTMKFEKFFARSTPA